ncbi:MAG: hypothetical protein NTX50_17290 [Candidatus Sumerlaeota bacterium]|nr:hypothetical protein [Candidatus Sumerlaeota bacterium]
MTRTEMQAPLQKLMQCHRRKTPTPVIFAALYATKEKKAIHLLEVCKGVSNPGDASWETFEMLAPLDLGFPPKTTLKITYISPEEFFDATQKPKSKGYRLLEKIQREGCEPIFRDKSKATQKIIKTIECQN